MQPLQKFPSHLKHISTLPRELWMFKIAIELVLIIQPKVNRTSSFKLLVKFIYF